MNRRSSLRPSVPVVLAAFVVALGLQGCSGALQGAVSASVRAGLEEHFTTAERCRELTTPASSGGADLALAAPLSLGNPADLVEQLEATVTGAINTSDGAINTSQSSLSAQLARALSTLERDELVGPSCRGESPGTEGLTFGVRTSVGRVCEDLRAVRGAVEHGVTDVRGLFDGLRAEAGGLSTACSDVSGNIERPEGENTVRVAGRARCGLAIARVLSQLARGDARATIERGLRSLEALPRLTEALGDHALDLRAAFRAAAAGASVSVSARVTSVAVQTGAGAASETAALTAGAIARVERRLGDALALGRGTASFFGRGLPVLRALVRGDTGALARAVLDRGLFDSAAQALLRAIEPELRRLDAVLDRFDEATFGLVSLTTAVFSPEMTSALRDAAVAIEALLERAHVPVLAFVRASCEAMTARRREIENSRTIPRLYRALVDAYFVQHPGRGGTPGAAARREAVRDGRRNRLAQFQSHVVADALARSLVASTRPGQPIQEDEVRTVAPALGAALATRAEAVVVAAAESGPQIALVQAEAGSETVRALPSADDPIAVVREQAFGARDEAGDAISPLAPARALLEAAVREPGGGPAAQQVQGSQETAALVSALSTAVAAVERAASTAQSGAPPLVVSAAPGAGAASTDAVAAAARERDLDEMRAAVAAQRDVSNELRALLAAQTAALRTLAEGQSANVETRFCAALAGSLHCQASAGGTYAIELDNEFPSNQWTDAAMQTALVALGRTARRFGLSLDAEVHGYASNATPPCASVPGLRHGARAPNGSIAPVTLPPEARITTADPPTLNVRLGDTNATVVCDDRQGEGHGDGNEALALLRATWAAHLLQGGSGGTIAVRAVRNFGSEFAGSGNSRLDRHVRIVFWRRPPPAATGHPAPAR